MNILFVYGNTINPERGGVQKVTSLLADYFRNLNHNVFYLSFPKGKNENQTLSFQYYFPHNTFCKENVYFIEKFISENQINVLINQGGISPILSNIIFQIKSNELKIISVIHNSILTGIKNFSALYYTRAKRYHLDFLLPLAKTSLGQFVLKSLYKRKYSKHFTNLCKYSHHVVILSEYLREELLFMTSGRYNEKIYSIPNFIQLNGSLPDVNSKKNVVLFVGRIDTTYKRVDLLLRIWQLVSKNNPNWVLKIVGGGIELPKLIKFANKVKLERIFFEGFKNPIPYYQEASIICLTSSSESFGMVLIEAMQFGVIPVVFNSFPTLADIVEDNKNGILIEPFDLKYFAKEIELLMSNEPFRNELSHNAYIKSCEFSLDRIGKLWEAIIY